MNPLFVCIRKGHILMIVILLCFPDKLSLNLHLMREKSLLNLLNFDLRFDIVFALKFDHYPDRIPISIGKKLFRIQTNRLTKDKPLIKVDKHLEF